MKILPILSVCLGYVLQEVNASSSFFNPTNRIPQFQAAFKSSIIGKFLISSLFSGLFPHPFLQSRVSTLALKDKVTSDALFISDLLDLDDQNGVNIEDSGSKSDSVLLNKTGNDEIESQPASLYLQNTTTLRLGDVLSDRNGDFFFFVSTVKGTDTMCVLTALDTGYIFNGKCVTEFTLVKTVDPDEFECLDYLNDPEIRDIFKVYQKFYGKYLMQSSEHLLHFVAPIDSFDEFVRGEFKLRLGKINSKNVLVPKAIVPAPSERNAVSCDVCEDSSGTGNASPDSIVEYWAKGKGEENENKKFKLMFNVARENTDELSMFRMDFIRSEIIPKFLALKSLSLEMAQYIVKSAECIFGQEPVVPYVTIAEHENITVVGDIHGQFQDLIKILEKVGFPSASNKILFNGDIVDRGSQSIECLLLIILLKITFPYSVFVNRGNHESRGCGRCKFYLDCHKYYGVVEDSGILKNKTNKPKRMNFFDTCQSFFETIPIAHVINSKIYVVHGGITSDLRIDSISRMNKHEPGKYLSGYIHLSTWYDPSEVAGITPNPDRGSNVKFFGPDVTQAFLKLNRFDLIIRSHTLIDKGFQEMHDGKCFTVFSAPNYCHGTNTAAVIKINHRLEKNVLYFK